jgi:hypothetical protein
MASWSARTLSARASEIAGLQQLWRLGWLILFVLAKKSLACWTSDL